MDDKKKRIQDLLANEDRNMKEDAELQRLQREVSLERTEVSMSELKRQAAMVGVVFKVGMSKVALQKAIANASQNA